MNLSELQHGKFKNPIIFFLKLNLNGTFFFITVINLNFVFQENLQINPSFKQEEYHESSKFRDKVDLILVPLHEHLGSQPLKTQIEMANSVLVILNKKS